MSAVQTSLIEGVVKPTFSGHESFACRQFWLKKGYDFVAEGHAFSDDDAVVHLGVGKNMVTSIHFWGRAFGLLDEGQRPTRLADYLFGPAGRDPYLEDLGSLYLLHYSLVTMGYATTYALVFNEFRKERTEFTRDQLTHFLSRKCEEWGVAVSEATLERDASLLIRSYLRPDRRSRSVEDDFAALLIDLDMLEEIEQPRSAGGTHYRIPPRDREQLPTDIALFAILQQNSGASISFNTLLNDPNNVGVVFALTGNGLRRKVDEIVQGYAGVTFTADGGVQELQFIERPDPWKVLERYYTREGVS